MFIEFESFRVKYRYQSTQISMDRVSAFGKTKDSDAGFWFGTWLGIFGDLAVNEQFVCWCVFFAKEMQV